MVTVWLAVSLVGAACSGSDSVSEVGEPATPAPRATPTLEPQPTPAPTASPRAPTPEPEADDAVDRFTIGDATVGLVGVESITGDAAALRQFDPADRSRLYASYHTDGRMLSAVHVYSYAEPAAGAGVPEEFERFDTPTEINGRPAIHGSWFDDPSRELPTGAELVWFANPVRYVWLRSRSGTVDRLLDVAQGLAVGIEDAEWADPREGFAVVATGLGITSPGDHVVDRTGLRATYAVESPDGVETLEVLLVEPVIDAEIEWLRSLALEENPAEVRGRQAYALLTQPTTSSSPGQVLVVWQEDDATIGIAWMDSIRWVEALIAAANDFDPGTA